jgi:hypothetical protein
MKMGAETADAYPLGKWKAIPFLLSRESHRGVFFTGAGVGFAPAFLLGAAAG